MRSIPSSPATDQKGTRYAINVTAALVPPGDLSQLSFAAGRVTRSDVFGKQAVASSCNAQELSVCGQVFDAKAHVKSLPNSSRGSNSPEPRQKAS